MGLTFSAPFEENSVPSNDVQNIKNFANVEDNNVLDTLNISELNPQAKTQMPLVGGFDSESEFAYNYPQKVVYRKERYNNYDLFDVMTNLEAKNNIVGGNLNNIIGGGPEDDEVTQTSSSNHGMDAIKSIIMQEIDNYKKNKLNNESDNFVGGGDCGCSGDNKILEGGKKKKNKKTKKVMKGGLSSSSSDSSFNNYKVNRKEITDASSNENIENEEKGLSIFPLNSSDVSNQTSSERNLRMLRRKI